MVDQVAKVRVLLGVLVVLSMALFFGAGCGQSSDQGQQSSDQSQALEAQQQENAELQEKLDAQEEEQEAAEEQQAAAEREELQQENEELQEELEAQKGEQEESEPQETTPPEPEPDSPDVVIETAPPSQAPQGVVVVSPDFGNQAVTAEEAQALDAAISYYQAVEVGDYYTTHSLLSAYDQDYFPVDTWVAANTELDSAAGEFVVTDAYPEDVGNGSPTYAVTLTVYLTDGSSSFRKTYFTNEGNGYWAHWLSTEEMSLFNGVL